MKILHIMAGLQPSGMERMFLSSTEEWRRHGICCEILATADDIGPFSDPLRAAGYTIHHVPFRSRYPLLPRISFLRRYWHLCRFSGFDLIHIHTEEATVLFALLARLAGVRKLALTVHNSFRFAGSLRLRKIVERWLVRIVGGRFGFVSDAVASNEGARFYNRGVRITNWVDVVHFRPPSTVERDGARRSLDLAPSSTAILTVGNCNAAKNHGALLTALSLIAERHSFVYLHVGAEQLGEPERQLATTLRLSVRFVGVQQDVLPWLWAADIFAMPSRHEGLAIAPLEAIAAGCTTVLAAVDGLAEIGAHAPNVVFAAPDPEPLAESILQLLETSTDLRCKRALSDSTSLRDHFSPKAAIDTMCLVLYELDSQAAS